MPKPGFYYYDHIRALRTLAFFGLFALGVFLSKSGFDPHMTFLETIGAFRIPITIGCLALLLCLALLWLFRVRFVLAGAVLLFFILMAVFLFSGISSPPAELATYLGD